MVTQARELDHNDPAAASVRSAAAFGAATAVTVLFNVVLAFVKDAYSPLNSFMAHLTGHHWITHGLADVVVFVALGWLFTARGIPASGLTQGLAAALGFAAVIAGVALGGWFILF
jgi:hypothetical protein